MEHARTHASGRDRIPNISPTLEPPYTVARAASRPIRVLIADSRPLVLDALADLIDRQRPKMEAVGTAASYARALYLAEREQPDVILLSYFQDSLDALGAIAAILRICNARVLLLKGMHEPVPVGRVLRLGAAGVVIAEEPTEAILRAVAQVHEVGIGCEPPVKLAPVRPRPAAQPLSALTDAFSRLTERERELVRELVENPGAKYFVIGAKLGISEHTVHNHLSNIYHKLHLVNRNDLVVYAVRHGLGAGQPAIPQV